MTLLKRLMTLSPIYLILIENMIHLQKIVIGYLDKYKSQNFSLFPHALDRRNKLKSKDEWTKKLDDLFHLRKDKAINEKGHAWWATTIEEMVKVQILFDSLKQKFIKIDKESEYVIKK